LPCLLTTGVYPYRYRESNSHRNHRAGVQGPGGESEEASLVACELRTRWPKDRGTSGLSRPPKKTSSSPAADRSGNYSFAIQALSAMWISWSAHPRGSDPAAEEEKGWFKVRR